MNRQQQNHRLRMDSCLSHWGRGLKFTLVRDPVVKAQQLFSWHGKTDCFVIDIQISVCLKKRLFSLY